MRVTESSIASNFLYNIGETNQRITQEQTELATGKSVNTVSDNPQAANTILRLKVAYQQQQPVSAKQHNGSIAGSSDGIGIGQLHQYHDKLERSYGPGDERIAEQCRSADVCRSGGPASRQRLSISPTRSRTESIFSAARTRCSSLLRLQRMIRPSPQIRTASLDRFKFPSTKASTRS